MSCCGRSKQPDPNLKNQKVIKRRSLRSNRYVCDKCGSTMVRTHKYDSQRKRNIINYRCTNISCKAERLAR